MGFFDQFGHQIFVAIIKDWLLLVKLLIYSLEIKCYYFIDFQIDYL